MTFETCLELSLWLKFDLGNRNLINLGHNTLIIENVCIIIILL